ncbi:MAG: hypothetical protein DMD35_10620 [Gemmatimonadetes bacterium]|nr:MAG: hypothetical protein DMD35_10620 [Gemmatimonadota bacterium]
MVSYVTTDEATRRRVEDKLASRIPNSFAAWRSVPDLSAKDHAAASAMLNEKLFDGAIVMRVVDQQDSQTYVPTEAWYSGYPSFYGYWGASWGMVQRPGYVVSDRLVSVETAIYSITDDKLLWAGRTRMLASSSDKLMDESADRVIDELRKQQLIQ